MTVSNKEQQVRPRPRLRQRRALLPVASVVALLVLAGCTKMGGGGGGGNGGGGTGPTDFPALSGNWTLTGGSAGASPVPVAAMPITMTGVIAEQATGASRFTTSVLQVQAPCYSNAQIVPLDGQVTATRFQAASFNVVGQFLTLDATKNADATQLTGTYSIKGGCADGQGGSITGQRYAEFTGTYTGTPSASAGKAVSVSVTQDTNGTGLGNFIVTGAAALSGFSCFNSGQIGQAESFITGSSVFLRVVTNDPAGAQVLLQGKIDPAAQTLTLNSAAVTGGSCAGDLGPFVLQKQ